MTTPNTESFCLGYLAGEGYGPVQVPPSIFPIWRIRERTELEAADQFARLAHGLSRLYGKNDPVAQMALQAESDERRHAILCRKILQLSSHPLETMPPALGVTLGTESLPLRQRVLYASVAMGCVTETLSTVLLIAMRKKAQPGLLREIVHEILEDEITHSRIGWAELSRQAAETEVTWLGACLPAMLREAVASDVRPMLSQKDAKKDLSAWGILPPSQASSLLLQSVCEILLPGLREFGVPTVKAERSLGPLFST